MNKQILIVIFTLFAIHDLLAQFDSFNNYFIYCENSTFKENYARLSASYNGNYNKAKEFIEKDSIILNNPILKVKIESLLKFNLNGEEFALSFIKNSNLNIEDKDYIKIWLATFTNEINNDKDKYEAYLKLDNELGLKYPKNYKIIKLKLEMFLFKGDKSEKTYENNLNKIDSLINCNHIYPEDKLYFNLLKLDYIKFKDNPNMHRYGHKATPDKVFYKNIINLYNTNKNKFNLLTLYKTLIDCDSKDCEIIKNKVIDSVYLDKNRLASERTIMMLYNYSFFKLHSKSKVENLLKLILDNEKDEEEIFKIKAVINSYTINRSNLLNGLSKEKRVFVSSSLIEGINFSSSIEKAFSFNYSKEIVDNYILKQYKEKNKYLLKFTKEEELKEQLNKADLNDLSNFIGEMLIVKHDDDKNTLKRYFLFNINKKRNMFDEYTIDEFLTEIDSNPLHSLSSHSLGRTNFINSLVIKSSKELTSLLNKLYDVKKRHLYSKSVDQKIMTTLYLNREFINNTNNTLFHNCFIKSLLDYVDSNYDFKKDFFSSLIHWEKDSYDSSLNGYYQSMNSESKIIVERELIDAITKSPRNENLNEIYKEFLDAKKKNK
jgi:hypothetical protein